MKCGHMQLHVCEHCGRCNSCSHQYVERGDGWWKRCPTLRWWRVIARRMMS